MNKTSEVEAVAKAIYNAMEYDGEGKKPEWIENGNSFKQDEARRYARISLNQFHQVMNEKIVAIKKLPSICGVCEKKGTNPYGECRCSYEDRDLLKRDDVLSILKQ